MSGQSSWDIKESYQRVIQRTIWWEIVRTSEASIDLPTD